MDRHTFSSLCLRSAFHLPGPLLLVAPPLGLLLFVDQFGPGADAGNAQVTVEFLDRVEERLILRREKDASSVFGVERVPVWDSDLHRLGLCSHGRIEAFPGISTEVVKARKGERAEERIDPESH